MRTLIQTLTALAAMSAPAMAATGGDSEAGGFFLYLFLGFFALIIVFQFTPGLVLFFSIVKELFSRAPKKAVAEGRPEHKDP